MKSTIRRIVAACLSTAIVAAASMPSMAQNIHILPLVMPASATQTGFVRIINGPEPGTVSLTAIDDTGERFGPVSLSLDAREVINFNSRDLEQGNAAKELSAGVGDGEGYWWLELSTDIEVITPLAYIRAHDGILISTHDVVPRERYMERWVRWAAFFNPATNEDRASRLRLINHGATATAITITARDDTGAWAPGGDVRLTLPAGAARMLTARELEAGGEGFSGSLGDGTGKWRLTVTPGDSGDRIEVMSLLANPTRGFVANLSALSNVPVISGLVIEPEYVCPVEIEVGAVVVQRTNLGNLRYRILSGGRFLNLDDPTDSGAFTYRRTGPATASVASTIPNVERCEGVFTCTTMTTGTFRTNCNEFGVGPYVISGTWELPESVVDLAIRDAQARWVGRNSFEGSVTLANLGDVPVHPMYGVEIAQDNHDGTFGVVSIPFGGPAIPPGSERTARHIFETLSRTNPDGRPIYPVGGSVEICFSITVPNEREEQTSNNCVTVTVEGE